MGGDALSLLDFFVLALVIASVTFTDFTCALIGAGLGFVSAVYEIGLCFPEVTDGDFMPWLKLLGIAFEDP